MSEFYPLMFSPIFKEKIWGGHKINTILGKDYGDLDNCGETWEISGVAGDVSIVSNGPLVGKPLDELVKKYKGRLVGNRVYDKYGDEFPLLVKFIDAAADLSIQVHPNDELAQQRHGCRGKAEMWYMLQADEGSSLISGFNCDLDKEAYLKALQNGHLESVLNRESVKAGDVFYLPAGRVHTIGKGLLLAEIQETSDVTYRIYDFDRIDKDGSKRELHTELALDALDFKKQKEYKTKYNKVADKAVQLIECSYFTTNKIELKSSVIRVNDDLDSFLIYLCVDGEARVETKTGAVDLQKGQACLVPAECTKELKLITNSFGELLESYIS